MKTQTMLAAAALVLSAGTGSATGAAAQETEESESWRAEAGLALTSSGGNENLTVITTEFGITHLETERYEMALGGRFRYGRSEGEDVAQNLRGTANVDLYPEAGWSPFLFATAEQDPFRKLDVRLNSGGGLKRTFWRDEWDEVSLSTAMLYSYENLDVMPADSVGDGITQTARWSVRSRARRRLGEGSRVEQIVYFQPAWNYVEDYLLESESSVRVALTQSLAVTSTLLYSRDSTPALDVDPDDWSIAVGLSMATTW